VKVGLSEFLEEEGTVLRGIRGMGGAFLFVLILDICHFLKVIIGRGVIYNLFCMGVHLYHFCWFSLLVKFNFGLFDYVLG